MRPARHRPLVPSLRDLDDKVVRRTWRNDQSAAARGDVSTMMSSWSLGPLPSFDGNSVTNPILSAYPMLRLVSLLNGRQLLCKHHSVLLASKCNTQEQLGASLLVSIPICFEP